MREIISEDQAERGSEAERQRRETVRGRENMEGRREGR